MKHKKTLIAIIILAVLLIAFLIQNYNSLNKYREKANNEYSNLSIIVDKKLDLTKNVIKELNTMKYKSNKLDKLKKSANKLEDAYNISTKNKYNKQVDDYLEKIESDIKKNNYKTTDKFNVLLSQISTQNEKLNKQVEKYNKKVNEYNNKISHIPNNITSKLFRMKTETVYS
jgi:LemA protein